MYDPTPPPGWTDEAWDRLIADLRARKPALHDRIIWAIFRTLKRLRRRP